MTDGAALIALERAEAERLALERRLDHYAAENQRLREALEEIATGPRVITARRVATAALAAGSGE